MLQSDDSIEVVGTAGDPYIARDKILSLKPDVLTLDIELPRMDGLTFLKLIMKQRPMPVIIISSLSQKGSKIALDSLRCGAIDVMAKPEGSCSVGDIGQQLIHKIKSAAIARLRKHETINQAPPLTAPPNAQSGFHPHQVILLGASTGGTEALKSILTTFPASIPGICIVQHIPPMFSKAFAEQLDHSCAIRVKEAEDGDRVQAGLALVAPGDYPILHTHWRWPVFWPVSAWMNLP